MTEQPLETPFNSDSEIPIASSAPVDEKPKRRSLAFAWFKKIAPWAVAAGIMYSLFSEVPIADAWAAARAARLEIFLPVMMIAVLLWFLIDSAAFAFLFSRFNAKLSWSEARSLRGMTYILTPINWNLGTAAVILHLRSSKQIGALDSTSSMAFYQMVDGLVLASYVGLGAALLPASPEIESLYKIALGIVVFQVASLWVFMGSKPGWGWLARFRNFGIFRTHQAAAPRDVAVLILMKGVYFSVFIGVFWSGCRAFGIDLPLQLAVAATPAILLAGALPITPAGLGTQQAAMLYFFSSHGSEASILAFGLAFPVTLLLFRLFLGLPYLKDMPKLRTAMAERNS
jgi:uncharacterized membrane protein YbhN (UPF0104 family)